MLGRHGRVRIPPQGKGMVPQDVVLFDAATHIV